MPWCDLVLEGGGVKGIGLVGAIEQLRGAGYQARRVAGTSAGAIVGALVAAGMPTHTMVTTMKQLDYTQFKDQGIIDRFGVGGKSLSLAFEKGIYEGRFLHRWIKDQLAALGVHTFADLKITEPWAEVLPPEQRYALTVIASDVSGGRMARLPWDYARYGLNPDDQLVADAVRASMSIPFFYEPVKLNKNFIVDGGLLSNFPIALFDATNDWPTFGVKLSAKPDAAKIANPVNHVYDFAKAIVGTALNAHDQMHIDDPCTQKRTIFIETYKIQATNFDISQEDQQILYESGQRSAKNFLADWDFVDYQKSCLS